MASTIKIKRSASAGNAPNNTNIDTAELALNTADRIMYSPMELMFSKLVPILRLLQSQDK